MKKYVDIWGPTFDPLMQQYFVKWSVGENSFKFKFFKTYSDAEKYISETINNKEKQS